MRRIALVGCAVAVVLAASGCGGGGDSSTASISRAQFIAKFDASCKKTEERIRADFQTYVTEHENEDLTKPTEEDFAKFINAVWIPNLEQKIEEIRALGVPAGDEAQVEAILDALEASREEAEVKPKQTFQESLPSVAKTNKLAEKYGLQACTV